MLRTYSVLITSFICCVSLTSGEFSFRGVFYALKCKLNFGECCDNKWQSLNFTDVALTLKSKVYGQHIAIETVLTHLKARSRGTPDKALVLSFHGSSGTGKSYFSKLVATTLFPKGLESKHVHLLSATRNFPHFNEPKMIDSYKDFLRDFIETKVKECPYSIFIIDEMDKIHPGLIDTLKPYVDFYERVDGVDYRKATFFLLSNTAANDINNHVIQHWRNAKKRESITLHEMEKVIMLPALNTQGGLLYSRLISHGLVTAFIPFLPLERTHVKQCIRDELICKGYYTTKDDIAETIVQEVADELAWLPDQLPFSDLGCKRVKEVTDRIARPDHDEF